MNNIVLSILFTESVLTMLNNTVDNCGQRGTTLFKPGPNNIVQCCAFFRCVDWSVEMLGRESNLTNLCNPSNKTGVTSET